MRCIYFAEIDFLDDRSGTAIRKYDDYKKFINSYNYDFVALGSYELRMNWIEEMTKAGFQIPFLIDPPSFVSPSAIIQVGSIICAKAVINANVKIEKGCIISIGALIDQDSIVREYSHINTGAIFKVNSNLERKKLDAGIIHSGEKQNNKTSYEIEV